MKRDAWLHVRLSRHELAALRRVARQNRVPVSFLARVQLLQGIQIAGQPVRDARQLDLWITEQDCAPPASRDE